MSNIFYILGFLAIMWEIFNIVSPKKMRDFVKDTVTRTNESRTNNQNVFLLFMTGYFLWILVGLLSSQWLIFVVMLVLSLIPKKYLIIRFINGLLSLGVLLFLLINHYHLHINLYDLLISYF